MSERRQNHSKPSHQDPIGSHHPHFTSCWVCLVLINTSLSFVFTLKSRKTSAFCLLANKFARPKPPTSATQSGTELLQLSLRAPTRTMGLQRGVLHVVCAPFLAFMRAVAPLVGCASACASMYGLGFSIISSHCGYGVCSNCRMHIVWMRSAAVLSCCMRSL